MAKKEPDGAAIIADAKRKVEAKRAKENKKENTQMRSVKKAVITAIVITALATAGLIYGGVQVYQFIYNQGVSAERSRTASVVDQAVSIAQKIDVPSKN